MDQFDDSFALEADGVQSLTPRKSPHLRRRGSLTHLNKILKPSSVTGFGFSGALGLTGAVSRKKISSMRKRMMNTMRKVMPMGRRTGYKQM
ncbi:hypothetical protein ZHAS_00001253 [Anopheles sinensis]|nr:hypothetical protein ZHAS_00001253 [Anopheles sinensis]